VTEIAAGIAFKSKVLRLTRELLNSEGFVELVTPTVRRVDDDFRPRPTVQLTGEKFLREAIGPALRHNLQFHPRVYEIGPCFRNDEPNETHAAEFTMLDLYAAHESFDFLQVLAEELIQQVYSGPMERVSVADAIRESFGVDARTSSEAEVRDALLGGLRLPKFWSMYPAVEVFVYNEMVPRSAGRALMLHDLPLGTEACARLQPDTTAVLNRFEILIDGVEVVHGYEDEPDSEEFVRRATEVCFYNDEQAHIQQEILAGRVPSQSVGLGIGIDRLCMVAGGSTDIGDFQNSRMF
jgi:lysyl-tRNA synthetase, class II